MTQAFARSVEQLPAPVGGGPLTTSKTSDSAARCGAWSALGALCVASMTLLVVLGTRLMFFNDDWNFLLHRRGLTAKVIFAPHNGHLSALAVLIYKGLVGLFGLGSQLPFRLVLAAAVAATGVFVYLLVPPAAISSSTPRC